MLILEYTGLDTSRHQAQYQKVVDAIARDDFRSADVKKLTNISHGRFYRAKLDYANRLLFCILRHGDAVYALMLEIIENHCYDKSRFLRGAEVNEDKLPMFEAFEAEREAEPVRYVHPQRREIHLLDKAISFDDVQEAVYRMPPPLIVVGSAGSGKTVLTLEKLKHTAGEVLYVTHSAYLAQSARRLYHSHGLAIEGQYTSFFSFREFLESLRVPQGREASWQDFAAWFGRMRHYSKGIQAHQAFEEIRGVLTANPDGVLSREAYRALGVRQSIFPVDQRDRLYDLYERYVEWLAEAKLFDLNLISHEWSEAAAPRYDFVVVDEAQDLTNAQLALILKTLKKPGHFLLCGDSNQIVHPNFFSWSQVKALFWHDSGLPERQEMEVLRANFRNSQEATRVANALLKIKYRRFGSIDRESNFLVDAVAGEVGVVAVLNDKESVKKELNQKTKGSTRFAVLVMRDEDKAEARRFFQTPLIFSIHEAKGLEYENIILYRFISDYRAEFSEIAAGVSAEDLQIDDLEYRRAKDKSDKSLEVYKFYVNALYVALTRALQNVYLIESDTRHELLGLLNLQAGEDKVAVTVKDSNLDDWQKEARKLELQGKQEQADAIRQTILQQTPVPWPVFDDARVWDVMNKVFRERVRSSKYRNQLYEYAVAYQEPLIPVYLLSDVVLNREHPEFRIKRPVMKQRSAVSCLHLMPYYNKGYKDILRQCERHGVDHRNPMNLTPLMLASIAGNVTLVDALLERGADREATDHMGSNALHWALQEAFENTKYVKGTFAEIVERVAPPYIDVMIDGRLVRIDRHASEYFLFQTLWAMFRRRFQSMEDKIPGGYDTDAILEAWQNMPPNVLDPARNKRSHISHLFARNERERDYAYNRRLFWRIQQGWYQFNPHLSVRSKTPEGETWQPIYAALNLKLVKEFSQVQYWVFINDLLETSGLGVPEDKIPMGVRCMLNRPRAKDAAGGTEVQEQQPLAEDSLKSQREEGPTMPAPQGPTSDVMA